MRLTALEIEVGTLVNPGGHRGDKVTDQLRDHLNRGSHLDFGKTWHQAIGRAAILFDRWDDDCA